MLRINDYEAKYSPTMNNIEYSPFLATSVTQTLIIYINNELLTCKRSFIF